MNDETLVLQSSPAKIVTLFSGHMGSSAPETLNLKPPFTSESA